LKDVEKKITAKTKAVIPVHLFGQMVDMKTLQKLVKSTAKRIAVIEDCAQSIGAALEGKQCGQWSDYGAFSFYPTKNLGAIGDAGMMCTNTEESAEKLRMLRVHGSKQRYYHEFIGANSRLDSIQAAVLRVKLRHLSVYEKRRSEVADSYIKLFKESGLVERIKLPLVGETRKHVWNQFTIRVRERDTLKKYLAEKGIGSEIYYPLAMHKQKAFNCGMKQASLPTCEALEQEVLSLPMFPELELKQIERVVATVLDYYKSR
jgi:dTDP-4-amino-4,6-dideoxygalactose transaminase